MQRLTVTPPKQTSPAAYLQEARNIVKKLLVVDQKLDFSDVLLLVVHHRINSNVCDTELARKMRGLFCGYTKDQKDALKSTHMGASTNQPANPHMWIANASSLFGTIFTQQWGCPNHRRQRMHLKTLFRIPVVAELEGSNPAQMCGFKIGMCMYVKMCIL
jgi:hypothetical protein